jgi:thymidylate synthase
MKNYLDLMQKVMTDGVAKSDRTGVGTRSLFGEQLRFDLSKGFPLITTKKIHMKSVIHELLWMLTGSTNVKYLRDNGVTIWDEWADAKGDLGPVYGEHWRSWNAFTDSADESIDQIQLLIEDLVLNSDSRRMIVTSWNPSNVDQCRLPPCHCFFQCYVADGKLSLHLYQRSADLFLGVPFNIASYALLTQMLAQITSLKLGDLIISFGDVHIYNNHGEQCYIQMARKPQPLPKIVLNPNVMNIDEFKYADIELVGYTSHPAIKADVAV